MNFTRKMFVTGIMASKTEYFTDKLGIGKVQERYTDLYDYVSTHMVI